MTIQYLSESGDKQPLAARKREPIFRVRSFTHPGLGQIGLDFRLQGKEKIDRRVPMSKTRWQQWRTNYETYRPPDFLFQGSQGGPDSQSPARKIINDAVSTVEIKRHITSPILSHSDATHLTESGVGLRYVQELPGHNDPKTTMI